MYEPTVLTNSCDYRDMRLRIYIMRARVCVCVSVCERNDVCSRGYHLR